MERFQIKDPGVSAPKHVLACLKNLKGRRFSAFTLVELIVVITILAILATIGFLALSGYSQDAKDSAIKANVRSVQTAISSEAAISGNSPRYFVVHDTGAALSGAFAYVDGSQTVLTGGNWNQAGTNYSAGNPDYARLKLNAEKFKVGYRGIEHAAAAFDSKYLVVGAFDATLGSGNKTRSVSYFQVAGIAPATGVAVVIGNFPATQSGGSSVGLIKDSKNSSLTGALMDGANSSLPTSPVGCSAISKTVNGRSYSVPAMTNGTTAPVMFNVPVTGGNVAYSQDFSCSNGTVATSGAETGGSTACLSGYSLISAACVPASCQSIKNAYPSSADGTYSIDPDGTWAGTAFNALCDMTTDGGGWTLVSYAGTIATNIQTTAGVATPTLAKPLFFEYGTYDANAKMTKSTFSRVRQFRPLMTETTEYLARRTSNGNNMIVFPMPNSKYSTWFWRNPAEGDFVIPTNATLPYVKMTNTGNSGWKTVNNGTYWSYETTSNYPGINWNDGGSSGITWWTAWASDNTDGYGNYATNLNHRSLLYWEVQDGWGQWFHAQPLSLVPSTWASNGFQDFEFYVRF